MHARKIHSLACYDSLIIDCVVCIDPTVQYKTPETLRACKMVFDHFVRKGLPFHYFDIKFDATFITSSQGITFWKYIQINSFTHLWEMWLFKCVNCILNHTVCQSIIPHAQLFINITSILVMNTLVSHDSVSDLIRLTLRSLVPWTHQI